MKSGFKNHVLSDGYYGPMIFSYEGGHAVDSFAHKFLVYASVLLAESSVRLHGVEEGDQRSKGKNITFDKNQNDELNVWIPIRFTK